MKRIGILGGAFNPIHLGHLNMAQTAIEKIKLDQVIFIPSFLSPHKSSKNLISSANRLKMTKFGIQGNVKFSVSDIEIKRKGKSYSIDTIRELKDRLTNKVKLFFIIGEDNYQTLHTWKNIDELLSLVEFIVVNREGCRKKSKKIKARFIEMPSMNLSSSFIRKSIAQRKSIQYYVPQKVFDYIRNNHLYNYK